MPTHKPDLTRLSLTQLAALVRCKPHTMRRRLDGLEPVQVDGRTRLYDAADALSRYFTGEALDLSRERARLAREQADQVAMRNAQARGELVPAGQIEGALVSVLGGVRTRILGLPSALAPKVAAISAAAAVEETLRAAFHEALEEIADGKLDLRAGPPK